LVKVKSNDEQTILVIKISLKIHTFKLKNNTNAIVQVTYFLGTIKIYHFLRWTFMTKINLHKKLKILFVLTLRKKRILQEFIFSASCCELIGMIKDLVLQMMKYNHMISLMSP